MPRRLTGLLPRASDYAGLVRSWRTDVVAGITVGVVALPLALGFGITTGLGAAAGLVTAVVAGLVAAVFGGSNVQVSGPTGAMTVVLVPVVATYGADAVVIVGILAGILVVASAIAGLGRYLAYVPWPVVEGFTVGIAIIIFLQQVPAALGVPKPDGENAALVAVEALVHATASSIPSVAVVVGTALVVALLPRLHRSLPASLIAIVVAAVVCAVAGVDVAVIGELPRSLPLPTVPSVSIDQLRSLLSPALAVAILCALESLLSARVADGMSDGPASEPDRELFGQGLANIASPLFGGMPATGAIARTAVNVRAGASTRVAAIVHSVVLILVIYLAAPVVAEIPVPALAGVLMVTAVRMVEPHNVMAVVRATRSDAAVLVLTAAATVVFDLIVAVEVGIAVAALLALRNVARAAQATREPLPSSVPAPASADDDVVTPEEERALLADHIVVYRLEGALFFGAAQRFLTELTDVSDVDVVILRLPQIQLIDATGAQALGQIVDELQRRGITVLLKGPRARHLEVLQRVGALDLLAGDAHVFDHLDDAIAHAEHHVRIRHHAGQVPSGGPT